MSIKQSLNHIATIRRSTVLIIAMGALLQGCTHTDHVAQPSLPDSYRNATSTVATFDGAWWTSLGDAELTRLIERASQANLDVEAATARIAAARARMGIAKSKSAPQIDSVTRSSREQMSENGLLLSSGGSDAFPNTYTLMTNGLDASWELDLFGSHAAGRRKTAAQYRDAVADRDAARLSLTAEVARIYVEHIAYSQQLASANAVVDLARERVELIEQQYANGQVASSELSAGKLELEAARAQVTPLRAEAEARRYAMGLLMGTSEAIELPVVSALLADETRVAKTEIATDVGLPSDLLRRRPDIRRAEAAFESAVADRSIAVADQYPRFAIVASGGYESIERGSLFNSASQFWALAPQLTLPLFDGGRRRSVVEQREAEVAAATAAYRQSVLAAFVDVEQALIRHHGAQRSMQSQVAALEHARAIVVQERARFDEGASTKPQWLLAQADFESHRQAALEGKKQALLSLITLYKSLGGDAEHGGSS